MGHVSKFTVDTFEIDWELMTPRLTAFDTTYREYAEDDLHWLYRMRNYVYTTDQDMLREF